jgi:pyrimidine oxygenase
MLDEVAATPGVKGILMTFDDFVIGMEQFGQYIQPLMKSRQHLQQGGIRAAA